MNNHDFNLQPSVDRGHLTTELVNAKSIDLEERDTQSLVDIFVKEDINPQLAVSNAKDDIVRAIDEISSRLKTGGRLFYLGAGTSGRLGVLDAVECPPTFCTDPNLIQGIIAGGESALIRSSEGLEDQDFAGKIDLKKKNFNSKDSLIGISAGGTTPYVLGALNYALSINSLTISITCVPKSQVSMRSDIDIRLVTGPELLTGSTRLKAGTATKMALNIISTCVMVRLGKTYSNYMVDLSATNEKLLDRSLRIIRDLANIDRNTSLHLLSQSKGSVKKALLMAISGISDLEKIDQLLVDNNDNLNEAIASIKKNESR